MFSTPLLVLFSHFFWSLQCQSVMNRERTGLWLWQTEHMRNPSVSHHLAFDCLKFTSITSNNICLKVNTIVMWFTLWYPSLSRHNNLSIKSLFYELPANSLYYYSKQIQIICSVCHNHNSVLSLFMTYQRMFNKSNTTRTTCRAGTANLSRAPEFTPRY
jgi:hypothetical protein